MKKISVVIGLYNSSKTIESVLEELKTELGKLPGYTYEIILVNDFSPDNVYDIVKAYAQKDHHVKLINLAKNAGQTNAVMTGYAYATGDYIVEMDDDFQMPAYEIGRMVRELEEKDLDVVFAKYREKKEGRFRILGSRVNSAMAEFMIGKPKDIVINSFFVMRSLVRDAMLQYENNYPYLYGIIFATTSRVGNLEVDHRPRTNGKSNYTFKKLFSLWANGLLNFSIKPLRLATAAGMIITGISFLVAIGLIIQKLFFPTGVIGWTSIVVAIIFFSGIQLISVGIIGEYMGRLYISSSKLPRTVVRETVNITEKELKDHE